MTHDDPFAFQSGMVHQKSLWGDNLWFVHVKQGHPLNAESPFLFYPLSLNLGINFFVKLLKLTFLFVSYKLLYSLTVHTCHV